ncbi:MAG: hypothetical protein HY927_00655 [Elusimicrobia bacterium]|nr:hypothetical protein [Elusimicrobiota bacterium]
MPPRYSPPRGGGEWRAAGVAFLILAVLALLTVPAPGSAATAEGAPRRESRPGQLQWHALSPQGVCVPKDPAALGAADLLSKLRPLGEASAELEVSLGRDSLFLGRHSCEAARRTRPAGSAAAGRPSAAAAPDGPPAPEAPPSAEPMPRPDAAGPRVAPQRAPRESAAAQDDGPPLQAYPSADFLAEESENRAKTSGAQKAWVYSAPSGFDEIVAFYTRQLGDAAPERKSDRRYVAVTPALELRVEKEQGDKVVISMIRRKSIIGVPGLETGGACASCSGISRSSSRTSGSSSTSLPSTSRIEKSYK